MRRWLIIHIALEVVCEPRILRPRVNLIVLTTDQLLLVSFEIWRPIIIFIEFGVLRVQDAHLLIGAQLIGELLLVRQAIRARVGHLAQISAPLNLIRTRRLRTVIRQLQFLLLLTAHIHVNYLVDRGGIALSIVGAPNIWRGAYASTRILYGNLSIVALLVEATLPIVNV